MNNIKFPTIFCFHVTYDITEQSAKVVEEAEESEDAITSMEPRKRIIEEICDVLQAVGNLCDLLDIGEYELAEGYSEVFSKNLERGYIGK